MATGNYTGAVKKRLMVIVTAKTAATYNQTVPTDTRGMKAIAFNLSVASCTGGSDAIDHEIQGSHDKSTWFALGLTFTQATAATTQTLRPTESTILPRWLRCQVIVATGATATSKVWIQYERRGDGSMAPTKAAQTTAVGAIA